MECKNNTVLIQCLESNEYMEIRNALIVLTKITSVFPVTRKTGINLEKRVAKIKGNGRENLKVLATGVAAALASRKSSWVTKEEFGKGFINLKPAPSSSMKYFAVAVSNGSAPNVSQHEVGGTRINPGIQVSEAGNPKSIDGRLERTENITNAKSDLGLQNKKLVRRLMVWILNLLFPPVLMEDIVLWISSFPVFNLHQAFHV